MPLTAETLVGVTPPFYVVDLPTLEQKVGWLQQAFGAGFPRVALAVSYKTNYLPAMLGWLHRRGVWAEVVSELELELAERLQVPPERIVYNGPGKQPSRLAEALRKGCLVNLDSLQEVDAVAALARHAAERPQVGLRVNLRLPDHPQHERRSRFGMTVAEGQLAEAARRLRSAGARVAGLHVHLTSRRREIAYYRAVAEDLVAAVQVVGEEELEYLDVGGGFGYAPPSMPQLTMPTFVDYAGVLHGVLVKGIRRLADLLVLAEPGLALVGDAVTYYAPVLATKRIGSRRVCVVDGSVHTVKPTRHRLSLPTQALDSQFEPKRGPMQIWDVVGYTCLEDDLIAEDLPLPDLEPGDMLAIGNVGAYTWVFKPQFIRAMPAFYTYDGVRLDLARRAETVDDFLSGYVFP